MNNFKTEQEKIEKEIMEIVDTCPKSSVGYQITLPKLEAQLSQLQKDKTMVKEAIDKWERNKHWNLTTTGLCTYRTCIIEEEDIEKLKQELGIENG